VGLFGVPLPALPALVGLPATQDAVMLGFYFENDPENVDFPDQTPGPPLVIIPQSEVLDAGALTTPPIQPSWRLPEEETQRWRRWTADDGPTITRPLFLTGRRLFSFQWVGLTAAEMEQVMSWADQLNEDAWKWLHPEENTTLVFRFLEQLRAQQRGILYSIGPVRTLELVFIGGVP